MELEKSERIDVLNSHLASLLECGKDEVYERLEILLNNLIQKKALHEYGVKKEELAVFADSVMKTQTRLMGQAYTRMTCDDVLEVYKNLH